MTVSSLLARLREGLRANHLVRGSLAVLLGSLGASVAGYVYWTFLSRGFGPSVVGEVSALGGGAAVVSLLSSHSAGSNLLARMHALGGAAQHALVRAVIVTIGPLSLLGGLVAALVLAVNGVSVLARPWVFALFVVGVAAQSVGATLDMVTVALRSARLSAARNAATAVLRLPVLLLVSSFVGSAGGSAAAVVASSSVSLVSVAWLAGRLGRLTNGGSRPAPLRAVYGDLGRGAFAQVVAAAGTGLPAQILPVLVVAVAGTYAGGQFGVAWLVGSSCFMIPPMVCASLLAEGSRETELLGAKVRQAALLITALLVLPLSAYVFAGDRVLSLFGKGFVDDGVSVLTLLAVSAFPNSVLNVSVSVLRARGLLRAAAASSAGSGVSVLLLAAAFVPSMGIVGAALGWLTGQVLGALVAVAACTAAGQGGVRSSSGDVRLWPFHARRGRYGS